jgi:hypothetical protein
MYEPVLWLQFERIRLTKIVGPTERGGDQELAGLPNFSEPLQANPDGPTSRQTSWVAKQQEATPSGNYSR